jgi:hypothetical protein
VQAADPAAVAGAAIAVASAAAISASGYLPNYSSVGPQFEIDSNELRIQLNKLQGLLTAARICYRNVAGNTNAASRDSSSNVISVEDVVSACGNSGCMPERAIVLIASSKTREECWRIVTTCSEFDAACEALDQVGLQLCNQMPMPWWCNNPHCGNLSGVSELQLVGGKTCVCGGCWVSR